MERALRDRTIAEVDRSVEVDLLRRAVTIYRHVSGDAADADGRGYRQQTIIEMEDGFLFVTAGGNGACLAVLCSEESDVGLIAYEMEMLVARVGQYMSTPARTPAAADR